MIVLYLFSTSNHNLRYFRRFFKGLSYISFLHQTTTLQEVRHRLYDCLISLFYIKPQPTSCRFSDKLIVLYLFSTSNHNVPRNNSLSVSLSYISFLHQTTTLVMLLDTLILLSYISFLHQTTTHMILCINVKVLSYISFLHQTTTV